MTKNFKNNKTILVTGGAGFIGSHLVDRLIKKGHKVIIVDKLYSGRKKNFDPQAKFFRFDVQNTKIFNIFKKEKPDIVYYLSGPINLRRRIDDPLFEKNLDILKGLKRFLDWSYISKVKKFVFVSSGGAIYSEAKIIPTSENHPVSTSSIYGLANLILEKLLEEYSKIYNLNFTILRLSNVYGSRQWKEGIIPSFIISLLKNEPPIINGNGKQTRDFIYIDDVIEAMLIVGIGKEVGIFNVGSGQEITIDKLYKKIAGILKKKIEPKYSFSQNIGAKRNALNCLKIKKIFNWKPKYSLDEGLKKTIKWFKTENNEN
jgi:UDP-glucose 4-epimerase